ncbi:MAG: tRNA lysidine(34) synthetase TilS [Chlorobiales bacterium]|nr:tRNA lysidine(34) synthetase TilS [Chlorobiales bacterium]
MNQVEQRFLEHIQTRKLLKRGDSLLIALSGGPDSMALLSLLHTIKPVLKLQVAAVHCNFQLRARASLQDERFCREHCDKLGTPIHIKAFDTAAFANEKKLSIEEAARHLRYAYFSALAGEYGYQKIATAHHANDNAETILFNLFRGASMLGLGGIPIENGAIIRPMLYLQREEILDYLKSKSIPYRIDKSNLTVDYDRNFIRHKVIPVIEKRFEHKLLPNLQRLSQNVGELQDFLDGHFEELMHRHGLRLEHGTLHVPALKSLTLFEQKEIFKRTLKELGIEPSAKRLSQLCTLLQTQPGRQIVINKHLQVLWKGKSIYFQKM